MAVSAQFGPNTAAVRTFLESVKDVPWFLRGWATHRAGRRIDARGVRFPRTTP